MNQYWSYENLSATGFYLSWIIPLVFWVIIIIAIGWLVKWAVRQGIKEKTFKRDNRALNILKERYARGEIGKAEFENRKRDILSIYLLD